MQLISYRYFSSPDEFEAWQKDKPSTTVIVSITPFNRSFNLDFDEAKGKCDGNTVECVFVVFRKSGVE